MKTKILPLVFLAGVMGCSQRQVIESGPDTQVYVTGAQQVEGSEPTFDPVLEPERYVAQNVLHGIPLVNATYEYGILSEHLEQMRATITLGDRVYVVQAERINPNDVAAKGASWRELYTEFSIEEGGFKSVDDRIDGSCDRGLHDGVEEFNRNSSVGLEHAADYQARMRDAARKLANLYLSGTVRGRINADVKLGSN